jgi:hypothetical protein
MSDSVAAAPEPEARSSVLAAPVEWHPLRAATLGVAILMLRFSLYHLASYPIIS